MDIILHPPPSGCKRLTLTLLQWRRRKHIPMKLWLSLYQCTPCHIQERMLSSQSQQSSIQFEIIKLFISSLYIHECLIIMLMAMIRILTYPCPVTYLTRRSMTKTVFWGEKSNRSLGFEHTLTASLSLMKTDRSCPFNSKNTSFSPLAVKSSAIASVLIPRVFPLSIVTFVKPYD